MRQKVLCLELKYTRLPFLTRVHIINTEQVIIKLVTDYIVSVLGYKCICIV